MPLVSELVRRVDTELKTMGMGTAESLREPAGRIWTEIYWTVAERTGETGKPW